MERGGCVYIMSNKYRSVLYIGVTSDLQGRIQQHKNHTFSGFTDRYQLEYCVYYEFYSRIEEAIAIEKQLKKWRRSKKDELITSKNPNWEDLWDTEIKKW